MSDRNLYDVPDRQRPGDRRSEAPSRRRVARPGGRTMPAPRPRTGGGSGGGGGGPVDLSGPNRFLLDSISTGRGGAGGGSSGPYSRQNLPEGVTPEMLATLPDELIDQYIAAANQSPAAGGTGVRDLTVPGQYNQQDLYGPVANNWSADRISNLQSDLEAIGFLAPGSYQPGIWGPESVLAYKELLTQANAGDVSASDLRNRYLDRATPLDGAAGEEERALQATVTSPADIASTARDVGRETLGRAPSDDLIRSIVGGVQSAQQGQQFRSQELSRDNETGVVQGAPSVPALAEREIRRAEPVEAGGYDMLKQFNSLLSIIGAAG